MNEFLLKSKLLGPTCDKWMTYGSANTPESHLQWGGYSQALAMFRLKEPEADAICAKFPWLEKFSIDEHEKAEFDKTIRCYSCKDREATYPEQDPVFCGEMCAADWAVQQMEGYYWCPDHHGWHHGAEPAECYFKMQERDNATT